MARIPTAADVNRVGVQRAPTVQVSPQAYGSEVGAAIEELGDTVGDIALQARKRAEATEAQDKANKLNKFSRELELGNGLDANDPDAIVGYRYLTGAEAMEKRAKYEERLENKRKELDASSSSDRVRAMFAGVASQHIERTMRTFAGHAADQQKVVEDGVYASTIAEMTQTAIAYSTQPEEVDKQASAIFLSAYEQSMKKVGDAGVAKSYAESALTKVHVAVIGDLLARGEPEAARAHYDKNLSEIDGNVRGELSKRVREGTRLGRAQDEFDTIRASGQGYSEQLATARTIEDPAMRKEVVAMVDAENARQIRQDALDEKGLRKEAIQHVEDGGPVSALSIEQREAMARTTGGMAALRRREQQIASGAPAFSDPKVDGELYLLFRDDKAKFMALDFTEAKYVRGLTNVDRDKYIGMQLSLDKDAVKQQTVSKKEAERSARLSRAMSIAKPLMKGLSLSDAQFGKFTKAMQDELNSRAEDGEKITDKTIMDITDGLLLRGEHLGSGTFDDDDMLFFEARADGLPFSPKDFIEENEQAVSAMARKIHIPESDASTIAQGLMESGIVVTPDTLRDTYNLIVESKGR